MKPQIISFKSISSQGLKAKTYVGVFGGAVRIIQRGFIKGNPHSSCEVRCLSMSKIQFLKANHNWII